MHCARRQAPCSPSLLPHTVPLLVQFHTRRCQCPAPLEQHLALERHFLTAASLDASGDDELERAEADTSRPSEVDAEGRSDAGRRVAACDGHNERQLHDASASGRYEVVVMESGEASRRSAAAVDRARQQRRRNSNWSPGESVHEGQTGRERRRLQE